jgi:hypothetical protein
MDERMANPDDWPCFPYLPLKRRREVGLQESGLLYALDVMRGVWIVYRGNVWDEDLDIEHCESEQYASFEKIKEVGWEVD